MTDEKRIAEIRARLENGPLAKWDSRERCEFEKNSPADIEYLLRMVDELAEVVAMAAQEFNAIRARDGAPQHIEWHRGQPLQSNSCTHEFWDSMTERLYSAIAKPTPEIKARS